VFYAGTDNTQYVCPQNTSGLSDEVNAAILRNTPQQNLPTIQQNNTNLENIQLNNDFNALDLASTAFSTTDPFDDNFSIPSSSYSSVTDDAQWKCDGFFCITVEFIIHQQNLLGG
jgi:hypothetical protein